MLKLGVTGPLRRRQCTNHSSCPLRRRHPPTGRYVQPRQMGRKRDAAQRRERHSALSATWRDWNGEAEGVHGEQEQNLGKRKRRPNRGRAHVPSHAPAGVGTAMLDALCRWAAQCGYGYCTVGWTLSNLVSDAFYRSRGFTPIRYRLRRCTSILASHGRTTPLTTVRSARRKAGLRCRGSTVLSLPPGHSRECDRASGRRWRWGCIPGRSVRCSRAFAGS
jgi:GNAT superfamily N-acetyltransferase